MREILLSIRPQWCEKIANGEKTIEVRKSRPKLETPFKCYIYCTQSEEKWLAGIIGQRPSQKLNGKVIGEFVCDHIVPMSIEYSNPNSKIALKEFPYTCLTDKEIIDYLGNGKTGYGWHISDLKIYDKPRELSEYGLNRAPQSWCYVGVKE